MKTLCLALLLIAAPALAGDECHNSGVEPDVTNWTIAAGPGSIIVDATLANGQRPLSGYYYGRNGDCCWGWRMGVVLWQIEGQGHGLDLSKAIVTDSTFHAEVPHEAGTFTYWACVAGWNGDAELCGCAYWQDGTLTVLPATTSARRVSWGQLRARWAR